MQRFHARAEFRRRDGAAAWVLAGVHVDHRFWPAQAGVQRLSGRLPVAGLAGWADLAQPILAEDIESAAAIALDVARARWPERVRADVPFPDGRGPSYRSP